MLADVNIGLCSCISAISGTYVSLEQINANIFLHRTKSIHWNTHIQPLCVSSTRSAKIGSVLETKAPGMALLSSVCFFFFLRFLSLLELDYFVNPFTVGLQGAQAQALDQL